MPTPDALLLIAPGCPHCTAVLDGLTRLLKENVIGALEVVNVAVHPERAAELGVRGVPWTRIGPFELDGAQPPGELRRWAERAAHPEGMTEYLTKLLAEGGLPQVEAMVAAEPGRLSTLLALLEDPALPMQVRLGINAVVDGLAGTEILNAAYPDFERLSRHPDHRVRVDACHFLGLTGRPEARALLQQRLNDEHPEVREFAREALDTLPPS